MATAANELSPEPSFGQMLRTLRSAAGLTQPDLAERANLSVRGISDLERGARTQPHFDTVRMLADALNLDPATREAFIRAARSPEVTVAPVAQRVPTGDLPLQLTPFVGREREISEIDRLIQDDIRLITLIGTGGVGKTRLALQLANDLRAEFTDGVAFVQLAPVADEAFVLPAVAQVLSIREDPGQPLIETLREHLRDQHLLLVLDNCEHVVMEVQPLGTMLLSSCPNIKILATSRAPLRLRSEQLFPVPSLALPDAAQLPSLEELALTEAVALFVQRARSVQPDFVLSDDNAAVVAEICRRLDGLPLAIELAAARLRLLSPSALLALLNERLRLLVGGPIDSPARHQTLEAAIAGSYDLLDPSEQALLRRLSVFAGGCPFEAAMAIAATGDEIATLNGLQGLLDHSLVVVTGGANGHRRFAMLETIREYALHRLSTDDDEHEIRTRHAAYFLDLAERGEKELTGPDQVTWMARLESEYPNLRSALSWSVDQEDAETALRLGSALWQFWAASGRLNEASGWLRRALDIDSESASDARAKALLRLGNMAVELANYGEARRWYEASLAIRRQTGNELGIASALGSLGFVAWSQGEYREARSVLENALTIWQELNDKRGIAVTLQNLGNTALAEGKFDDARELHEASLDLRNEMGDQLRVAYSRYWLGHLARIEGRTTEAKSQIDQSMVTFEEFGDLLGVAFACHELGRVAYDQGNAKSALDHYREALELRTQAGDVHGIIDCLEGTALVACSRAQEQECVSLFATAAAWRETRGVPAIPVLRNQYDHTLDIARVHLGEILFARAWDQGQHMTPGQAAEFAASLSDN
ncbi:MAG: ATP-binding protein [Thermomicrobiales bacterium]